MFQKSAIPALRLNEAQRARVLRELQLAWDHFHTPPFYSRINDEFCEPVVHELAHCVVSRIPFHRAHSYLISDVLSSRGNCPREEERTLSCELVMLKSLGVSEPDIIGLITVTADDQNLNERRIYKPASLREGYTNARKLLRRLHYWARRKSEVR